MATFLKIILWPLNFVKDLLIKVPLLAVKWSVKIPLKILKWVLMPVIFVMVVVVLPILLWLAPGWWYDWF